MKAPNKAPEPRRLAVAGAVRNQNAKSPRQTGNLRIEWINTVAPAAVQEEQRKASTVLAVIQIGGTVRVPDADEAHITAYFATTRRRRRNSGEGNPKTPTITGRACYDRFPKFEKVVRYPCL
jgi:hypothetical protein